MIVSGDFLMLGNTPAGRLARISRDGLVDTNFSIGSGFGGGPVYSVAEQYNGKLVVGGFFTNLNGQPASYLTRLHNNGERDATFQTGTGPNAPVLVTTLTPAGDTLLCGLFSRYDEVLADVTVMVFGDGGPWLGVQRTNHQTVLSWSALATNFALRQSPSAFGPWTNSSATPA